MLDQSPPNPKSKIENPKSSDSTSATPLRCITGSLIAGAMATGLYSLTVSIAQSFATKPIQSHNITVINITVAVRTLVVGVSTLATVIFGIIAIGLVALGVQLFIQQFKKQPNPPQS